MGTIRVYYTSVSGCMQIKEGQAQVTRILDTYKIKYELIDVSISEHVLQEMRAKTGNPNALPPQIFNGDDYCGDFEMLHEATENEEVWKFLKMASIVKPAKEGITV